MIFSIDSFMRASNGKRKAKNAARDNRAQNSNCNSPAGNLVSFFLFWTFSKALLRERRAGTGKRKETVGGARRFDPFLFSPPFLPAAPVSRAEFLSSVRILTSRARRRSKTLDQIPPLRDDAARFAQMAFFLSARARRPCRPALCLAKPVFCRPFALSPLNRLKDSSCPQQPTPAPSWSPSPPSGRCALAPCGPKSFTGRRS